MSNSPDAALFAVYQQYARSGLGGDLRFVDAVFTLLRKNTTLLNTDASIQQVQKLAVKHCEIGKKERAEKKKQAAAAATAASQSSNQTTPTSTSASTSTSQSSSQSTSQSSSNQSNQSNSQTSQSSTQSDQSTSDTPPATSHQSTGSVPINNGGTTDKYTWSQTLGDVTCVIKLPVTITSKQLNVSINSDSLNISIKQSNKVIISGDLHSRVLADDATWTLELDSNNQSKLLSIYLPKADRMQWWSCLIRGDQSIDVTKIQPENSQLSDLDTDTRQTVEKMMFDQRAKQTGEKTSDELTKEQALKRFMDLHPEMDFSQAKIL